MLRLRRAVVLFVLALGAAGLALVAVSDPFHLRQARWFTSGLVLLAVLLVTASLAVAVRGGPLRAIVLVLGGVAAVGWVLVVLAASRLLDDGPVVEEIAGDDGRRLVVLESASFNLDPTYAVVLRSGSGVFEQESLVYQGLPDGGVPTARFLDPSTVQVELGPGCRYRSTVEAVTLAVDPVHRPGSLAAC